MSFEQLTGTNGLSLLPCYGRVGGGIRSGGGDWGHFYNTDSCGDLEVWTVPGLGSGLRIYRDSPEQDRLLSFSVNPGLLHIARFAFSDAAFLEDCNECLFEANGYIYLLDIQKKRVGTVAHGERFIVLKERYRNQL